MSIHGEWNSLPGYFKATKSGGSNNCLEVTFAALPEVGIRDSKAGGEGDVLVVSAATFRGFIEAVKAGAFQQ